MNEDEARELAVEWLRALPFEAKMTAGKAVERPGYWIFESVAVNGERLFGNAPVLVNKGTGGVQFCRPACREFGAVVSINEKIRRWWHRWQTY